MAKIEFNFTICHDLPAHSYRSMELMFLKTRCIPTLFLIVVYRPPPSKNNGLTNSHFLEELDQLFSEVSVLPGNIIILGDFNIHWNKPKESCTRRFKTSLDSFGFRQHIEEPTHKAGNTIDFIISRMGEDIVLPNTNVFDDDLSDHFSVFCKCYLEFDRKHGEKYVNIRKFNAINTELFSKDLEKLVSNIKQGVQPKMGVEVLTGKYTEELCSLVDKHAQLKKIKVKQARKKPWYSDKIHQARLIRRKYERKWLRSRLDHHRELYKNQQRLVIVMIENAKSEYYQNELKKCKTKDMFKLVKSLTTDSKLHYPSCDSDKHLADRFLGYFNDKVEKITNIFPHKVPKVENTGTGVHCSMSQFSPVPYEQIYLIINSAPTKSCDLDSLPSKLVKANILKLGTIFHDIINMSLAEGIVPSQFKKSMVRPLLKNSSLDQELLQNYRPISNIPFLCKILEKVVAKQLTDYLKEQNLHDEYQSGYKAGHSMETGLVMMTDKIHMAFDRSEGMFLAMLDLSAAFDVVSHDILLTRLEQLGLKGIVLNWFKSYLQGRQFFVKINSSESKSCKLRTGVPQGSVLGPILFLVYMLPLKKIFFKIPGNLSFLRR